MEIMIRPKVMQCDGKNDQSQYDNKMDLLINHNIMHFYGNDDNHKMMKI